MSLNKASLRLLIAGLVVVVLVINLAIFSKESFSYTNAESTLEKQLDHLASDEYTNAMLKELKDAKKDELMEKIKQELVDEYKPTYLKALQEEIKKKNEALITAELRKEIDQRFTKDYFSLRKSHYNVFEELQKDYYEQNKDKVRDALALSALTSVLEKTDVSNDVKEQIDLQLEKTMSKKEYYRFVIEDLLVAQAPKMGPLTTHEKGPDLQNCVFNVNPVIYNKETLNRVKFSEERFNDFQTHHDKLVDLLRLLSPPPAHLFHGDGIVLSAGGAYFAGAFVSIAQIREMGSKLPIELLINTEKEYDENLCKQLKDTFNVKCVVIEREIGKELLEKLKLTKFQLKILGLLVTSFDNVIAIDADNMPIKNPDILLTSPAYLRTKFLLWPDIWQRTVSAKYYEIARIDYGEPVRRHGLKNEESGKDYFDRKPQEAHFHDLDGLPNAVSTETGQMVFSKREHFRSFYLALYYNVYGESHYWRMFYQGSPGDGDRDTFVPALHVFNEPYHVVERSSWLAGFKQPDGFFQETTIVQYDPITTEKFATEWRKYLKAQSLDSRFPFDQNTDFTKELLGKFDDEAGSDGPAKPEVMFLHVHRPKINPILETDPEGYFDCFKQRNLGLPNAYDEHFGEVDWELKFNIISQWVACKGLSSPAWWKSVGRDQKAVCSAIKEYVEFLESDAVDKTASDFKNINVSID